MGEPALWRLKVRHYEVDSYGHVNHANYAHYFETARIEALEGVGLSLAASLPTSPSNTARPPRPAKHWKS
jgi:acyl-CoA thioesterase FadM